MNTPAKLNILDIHRTMMQKKARRNEAFEKVLSICHTRIKAAAEDSKMFLFFVVPEFIIGFPIFSINDCLEYIMNQLKKNGFLVKYYFPKILYVSWDLDEIEREKNIDVLNIKSKLEQPKQLLTSSITSAKNGKLRLSL